MYSLCIQEKSKALGYITSNQKLAEQALKVMDEEAALRPPDNINEIHIKIIRYSGLKARREGTLIIKTISFNLSFRIL